MTNSNDIIKMVNKIMSKLSKSELEYFLEQVQTKPVEVACENLKLLIENKKSICPVCKSEYIPFDRETICPICKVGVN